MTDRKLGEMSYEELSAKCRAAYIDAGGALKRTPSVEEKAARVAMSDELEERSKAQEDGAIGRHAVLSREQVKSFVPGRKEYADPDTTQYNDGYTNGWNDCRAACARALLALPEDAASPLEE